MYEYDRRLKSNSQRLRREMTAEEKKLWYDLLCRLPVRAKRQYVIGSYILDFYIPKYKIAIEVDGRQHLTREHLSADAQRDFELGELGITVIRCSNEDVNLRFNSTANYMLSRMGIKASELSTHPQQKSM